MEEIFRVKIGEFEGPLDLLLDLIEKRKLHINDVSLSAVTDEFIKYVEQIKEYSIGGVAHFILVASTLLLIKSKSLLPNLPLSVDEQADIKDLEDRLKLLQRVRELSRHIKNNFGKEIIFAKSESRVFTPVFSPEESITKKGVLESIRAVIASIPIKEFVPQAIVKKVISIEEMIERLITRVQSSLKTSFKEFTKGKNKEKVEIVVSFLAMLELVKQGAIAVTQDEHFGDIQIETTGVGVPRII